MFACCPGKRLSFLVRRTIPVACLVFGAATSVFAQRDVFAQHVAFGIKAGVPLTDVVQNDAIGAWGANFGAQTKGYTIGPVMDIRFPGPLSIEVGAMYKRIDQQGPVVTLLGYTCLECEEGYAIREIQSISKAGRSWEFPVAVQYHIPLRSFRPYVEGGFSYNHLSNVLGSPYPPGFQQLNPRELPAVEFRPVDYSINRTGFFTGGGVEIKLPTGYLTPGLRYTRYDKVEYFLPSPNAVDFLVRFQLLKF